LVEARDWLVLASSLARLLHRRAEHGDSDRLLQLADQAKNLILGPLGTATPTEWKGVWLKLKGPGFLYTEFELFADSISHGKGIIELSIGAEQTREWFLATRQRTLAAYPQICVNRGQELSHFHGQNRATGVVAGQVAGRCARPSSPAGMTGPRRRWVG